MRRHITPLSVVFGLAVLPLIIACEEPTRPGPTDGDERAGAPGASAHLSAEIRGPTSIGPSERCSWSASLGGVRSRYSIEWWRRDAGDASWTLVETLPVYGGGMDGHSSFALRLDVRDANGFATAQMTVRAGAATGCEDESEDGGAQ